MVRVCSLTFARTAGLPRQVLVLLNPAARNFGSRPLFDKNVAPLLHLAGLDVTVMNTEQEGAAKQYLRVLDEEDTDVVMIAGGNGSVLEVSAC